MRKMENRDLRGRKEGQVMVDILPTGSSSLDDGRQESDGRPVPEPSGSSLFGRSLSVLDGACGNVRDISISACDRVLRST